MCRVCEVNVGKDGGRRDGEDSIISARLVQFVTPAVVFNQPPRAACTANSLIISLFLSLCPCGQLQQMGALSRDPQPPPDPPTWGTSLTTHTQACTCTVYKMHTPRIIALLTLSPGNSQPHAAALKHNPLVE